jgi:DNA phosphorothioation-dependent restriction protein DptG
MHRTRVILENKHYQILKELAGKEKKSMSQILREMIDSYAEKKDIFSLSSIAGIIEDLDSAGEDHDRYIYRI